MNVPAHEVMTLPVLGNAQISREASELLDDPRGLPQALIVIPWLEYGWILYFADDFSVESVPESSLRGVIQWAKDAGYSGVRLDRDASTIDELPVFAW